MAVAQVIMPLSFEEVINCSLPVWYDRFHDLTFKTVFISLPREFVDYLHNDGVFLPHGCVLPEIMSAECIGDNTHWEEEQEEEEKAPNFPDLVQRLLESITTLGGAVFPKLNWSSPKDAVWIAPSNTLRCTCPAEVILLLKSSDFIAHDLTRVFEYCKSSQLTDGHSFTYTLCLRRWEEVNMSGEFRCFVANSILIAVSQRDCTQWYSHIAKHKTAILQDIQEFFQSHIAGNFPSKNYVFDVYRPNKGRLFLVDFNPFSTMTDGLLFTWDELMQMGHSDTKSEKLEFRIVESHAGVQPGGLHSSRLSKDMVDLSTGEDIHKLVDLLQTHRLQQN